MSSVTDPPEVPGKTVGTGAVIGSSREDFVVVQGLRDTRATFAMWHADHWRVLRPWFAGAIGIAVLLLAAVWVVAKLVTPDPSPIGLAGVTHDSSLDDAWPILYRNSLVLALHAMACVAGFIAGSSLPLEAERYSGVWRRVHDRAGPLAIAFVGGATLFSLSTQAYVLGNAASTLAVQGHMSRTLLLVAILPHAVPELVGLFLPLAAWMLASRRGRWHELLAATFVTLAISIPLVVTAAFVEVFVSPHLILALRG